MDFLPRLSNRMGRGRRSRGSRFRPQTCAIVERLERRTLLTLQAQPITTVVGQNFSGTVATFAAGDVDGSGPADYQATINWQGALSFSTAGAIVSNGPGTYLIESSNVFPNVGKYAFSVILTGLNNTSATSSATATVADAPLSTSPTTIYPGLQSPFSGAVASFTTPDPYAVPGDYKATINWGDGSPGSTTTGTVASAGQGSFNVVGQYTYNTVGSYPVNVTISSPGGSVNVVNSTATVVTQPVSLLPANVTGAQGQALSNVTVASFLDPYTSDTASDFQASIHWGDGNLSFGTITGGNGAFTIQGSNTYLTSGTYTITLQLVRVANGQVVNGAGQAVISVGSTALGSPTGVLLATPAGVAINNAVVGTFLDSDTSAVPSDLTAVIQWGDGSTSSGTVQLLQTNASNLRFQVLGSHLYTTPGTYTPSIQVADLKGGSTTISSTADVLNSASNFNFSGGLAPIPGNGPYASQGDTNTNRPTFSGTAPAFATVELFGRLAGYDANNALGTAIASGSGQWSLAVGPLSDGMYSVTAVVTPPSGYPSAAQVLGPTGNYVIDTVAPQVVGAVFGGRHQVTILFRDGLSGMNQSSLAQAGNYYLSGPGLGTIHPTTVTVLPAAVPNGVQQVVLTMPANRRSRGMIRGVAVNGAGASGSSAAGITDNAGNPLLGFTEGLLNVGKARGAAQALTVGLGIR